MPFTNRLYNFTWQLPGKIATGSKPSFPDQVDWLAERKIGAIVSLEETSDIAQEAIRTRGIIHISLPVSDSSSHDFDPYQVDQKFWNNFVGFLETALTENIVTYVHCSAGITRSVRLIKRFLREHCPP